MSDLQREITHNNVEKLVEAIRGERAARDELFYRIVALEKQVQMLTVELQSANNRANTALALVRNMNGSSTGD
jgi:vacuolar-type H+-ATPase subunit D/Vma8